MLRLVTQIPAHSEQSSSYASYILFLPYPYGPQRPLVRRNPERASARSSSVLFSFWSYYYLVKSVKNCLPNSTEILSQRLFDGLSIVQHQSRFELFCL